MHMAVFKYYANAVISQEVGQRSQRRLPAQTSGALGVLQRWVCFNERT
jgi:hypothetical protein